MNQIFRRNPVILLFIVLILVINVISRTDALRNLHIGTVDLLEWMSPILSILYFEEIFSMILLIAALIFLGPTLEKIYGPVRMTVLFFFPSLFGALYFYHFTDYIQTYSELLIISNIFGIYCLLILKKHHMITKIERVCIGLLTISTILLITLFPIFPKEEVIAGFVGGFILAIFVKPQAFRNLFKMQWGKSIAQSFIVVVVLSVIFNGINDVDKAHIEKIEEWVTGIRTGISLEKDVSTTLTNQNSIQEAFVPKEPIYKTGDEIYNAILSGLQNLEDSVYVGTADSNYVFTVLQQVLNDHPEIFYFDYKNSRMWSNGKIELGYRYDKSDIEAIREQIDTTVQEIYASVLNNGQSEYEVVKALHDYIVLNTVYDYDNYLAGTVPDESYTMIGPLLYGTAVCDGYARAMYYLLNQIGIETLYVTGYGDGQLHAWNKVKIDGEWYNLDATWDDPVPDRPNKVSYDYFLITDERLAREHEWDQEAFPAATDTSYMKKSWF